MLGHAIAAGTRQVYDVAHNIAKLEQHGGRDGVRASQGCDPRLPARSTPEIPAEYAAAGQPVFIPGSMGTSSFVLAGRPGAMERSFGTTCHGAGRRMSRTAVRKAVDGVALRWQLEARGNRRAGAVGARPRRGGASAYKDVDRVVEIVERAGLAARVARLRPIGVVKG